MRIKALGCLLFLAFGTTALAQEPDPDCTAPVTQMDMNICADRDHAEADEALNTAYRDAVAAMEKRDAELAEIDANDVGAVEALKRAQRGWIAYRDGSCDLAGFEARGGSMEPMLVSGCLAEMTRQRTRELKTMLEENEG